MITNDVPVTVYIRFTGELPRCFVLTDLDDNVEYFRHTDGKTPRIKFNLPIPGRWIGNTDFEITKTCAIEIPDNLPVLPAAERNRWPSEIKREYDPSWSCSPASNFSELGLIVYGPAYYELCRPIRVFIDLHEQGHFLYRTEEYCDLFAFVNFIRMGYNRSTAFYSLQKVLQRTTQAMARIDMMMKNINSATGAFNPD